MNFLRSAVAASLMLVVNSCNYHKDRLENLAKSEEVQLESVTIDSATRASGGTAGADGDKQQPGKRAPMPQVNADWEKKIIKTALLNIQVEEYQKYNEGIHQMVNQWQGYISREEENDSDYKIENSLTIKVPVAKFDEAISYLSSDKSKILVKQITSQDVTGEILDVRARMDAKRRVRLRYLDMLQKAKNMEEILQIEREINQMQEQIEAADGRINYLSHAASYSTIELTFFQVLDPKAIDKGNPGFGKRIFIALNEGLKWVGELVILLLTLWPLWIFGAFAIVMINKLRKPKTI